MNSKHQSKKRAMIKQPILEEKVYSNKKPKGYHTIKVWESEKEEGKYSFSIAYGAGVMSKCDRYDLDSSGQFGQFRTPEDAMLAGKLIVGE